MTIRLDKLNENEAFELMNEVGQRQPAVNAALARTNDVTRRELYQTLGGNPFALHLTLGLVASKGYSIEGALKRLQDPVRSEDLFQYLFADATGDLQNKEWAIIITLAAHRVSARLETLMDATQLTRNTVELSLERLVELSLVSDLADGSYGLHPLTRVFVNTHAAKHIPTAFPVSPTWMPTSESASASNKDNHVSSLDLNNILQDIDALIGLESVKDYVHNLVSQVHYMQLYQKHSQMNLHLVFTGNPGTGKTTIARELGRILVALGLLRRGHLVQVNRGDLVGAYIGHTETRTAQVIQSATDGVLFIEDAYTLTPLNVADYFGQQAIQVLIDAMDTYKDRLVVIMAGYSSEMDGLLESSPGLRSRFRFTIDFPDYTSKELFEILKQKVHVRGLYLSPQAEVIASQLLETLYQIRDSSFGNAREVENLLDDVERRMALRIMALTSDLARNQAAGIIQPEDIPATYTRILESTASRSRKDEVD